MKHLWKNSLLVFVFGGCIYNSDAAPKGIRPNVYVSPQNVHSRDNPKIKASDLQFDVRTAKINQGMIPTLEKFANEVSILINNLYKRKELDEVNVRSLMRIRLYLAYVYQAIQNPTSTQVKLQKRIIEAVREINEELAHRLDFEERYKSGLIAMPKGKSTSSFGTQTEDERVSGSGSPSSLEGIKNRSDGPFSEKKPALSAVSSGVVSEAQRSQPPVIPAYPSGPQIISTTDELAGASPRSRALVNLVKSGKISINDLSAKDQTIVRSYLNKLSLAGSGNQSLLSRGAAEASLPPSSLPGHLNHQRGSQIAVAQAPVSREGLPARTQALLNLVESGKLPLENLSVKDRELIAPYLNKGVPVSQNNLPSSGEVAKATLPPPSSAPLTPSPPPLPTSGVQPTTQSSKIPGSTSRGSVGAVSSNPQESKQESTLALSRDGLPARTQALLNLVDSGRLPLKNLSAKDQELVGPYLNKQTKTGSIEK